jgi:dTDP-4-amino-4,6-dideoxygalactose transaminase
VLENGAWSCGATYHGKAVGTFGEAGIYSLQSVKVLTAGEGGVVLTQDPVVYERAFRYHDHGNLRLQAIPGSLAEGAEADASAPQLEPFIGAAFRMNELTGAVALAQVRKLDGLLEVTRRAQRAFLAGLRGVVVGFRGEGAPFSLREVPDPEGDCGIAVGLTFRDVETAQRYQAALRAEGVPLSGLYGGRPVYALPQMRSLKPVWTNEAPLVRGERPVYEDGLCPRTEDLMRRMLLLSVTPAYGDAEARDAAEAIGKVARALG